MFFYGTSFERAGDLTDTDVAMSRSLSYKNNLTSGELDLTTITLGVIDNLIRLTSDTHYYGAERGEEIANFAYNYSVKKSAPTVYTASVLKTTSVYYYGDSDLRANNGATSEDRMTISETYKTTDILLIDKTDDATAPNIQSETHYVGDKGDEIADYSFNYQ